jgi:signal transduction histidine kinase
MGPSALAGQTGPVREIVFGGDQDFPPYEFVDAQGQPAGLNVDLIRAIGRAQGIHVRVVMRPWHEIRAGVTDGTLDVATMFRSRLRAREADFAIPHELIYQEMYVRPGGPMLKSLSDLAGKRLLAQTDALAAETLADLGLGGTLRVLPSEPEALRALVRGEGDVAIVTQTVARPFADREEFAGRIVASGPPVLLTEYGYATRPGRGALIESLNQGLARVKASGEYGRIFDHWMRPDRSAVRLRHLLWGALLILAGALLVVVWNYALRKRVQLQSREIGELDTSYHRLAEYQAEIDRANQELEAFSYSVSHDLRAPLRTIRSYTSILVEDHGASLNEEGRQLCDRIQAGAATMSQLIDDLLNLSRLSRIEMEPVPVDMQELAAGVYATVGAPGVEFKLEALPGVRGDPRLLRQVWTNLLSNAVKFSSKRERPVIQVSGGESSTECLYAVRDNGAGFDPAYASKLFEVFQRLHSTREFEGTGVGLAIVKRIVTRHGGRVWAEGAPGQGATFHFALPRKNAA